VKRNSISSGWRRWAQLALGIVCMVAIANLQYGWTLFINPIDQKHGWGTAAIQWTFTIAIATETVVPALGGGRLVDRLGPSLIWVSGPLIALAWYLNSIADALILFYVDAVISGVGVGLIFAAVNGNALKWFPDRRGFAIGLTAAGFAGGGAVTVVPLASMIQASGYEAAYLWFGIGQGLVVLVTALLLRAPRSDEIVAPASSQVPQGRYDYTIGEIWKSPPFWLMYAMFVMVAAGGLITIAQLAPVAAHFGIANSPLSVLGLSMLTIALALSFGQVMNGLSRPVFGAISDRFGRERTMFIAFMLEGFAIALIPFATNPIWFVLCVGLVFFAWGEIFALFPATCTDTYGARFASANYGLLYTAKGTAALLVPFANVLNQATGSWTAVFAVAAALNVVAALLALFVLKPVRMRVMASER
jgi:OFA family oxalate/formate antiporter-like MFS transporter